MGHLYKKRRIPLFCPPFFKGWLPPPKKKEDERSVPSPKKKLRMEGVQGGPKKGDACPFSIFFMECVFREFSCNFEEQKRHKKNTHKISENPLDGRVSLDTRPVVPAKMPFSVRFSIVNNRKPLGHRPVDPCLSRRVSQGHPAGVPGIFLKFMCPFVSWNFCSSVLYW